MSKNAKNKRTNAAVIDGKFYPLVSVCTPTYNRRPFLKYMFQCFLNQTYPRTRMEWIIVDDGTDRIKDVIDDIDIPQIKYFEVKQKMTLGQKRNYMHSKCNGSIIVYMDDDDYYPPERVEHAVDMLTANPEALCAGSSEIYIYFKHISQMFQFGPYGPTHATAGTFAFKRELLNMTKYDESASLAEEKAFLKDYTIPFVQLDPFKTILVFSHIHNTFDKKRLLENKDPTYCKESDVPISRFIKNDSEKPLIQFFMNDIDKLLEDYVYGYPVYKPDVIRQMKQLEDERNKMQLDHFKQMQEKNITITNKETGDTMTVEDLIGKYNEIMNENQMLKHRINELNQFIEQFTGGGGASAPVPIPPVQPKSFHSESTSKNIPKVSPTITLMD
jgi:glycosyltransferase involved in cell wall biosynthesis